MFTKTLCGVTERVKFKNETTNNNSLLRLVTYVSYNIDGPRRLVRAETHRIDDGQQSRSKPDIRYNTVKVRVTVQRIAL